MPSREYDEAIAEAALHHQQSKTYSGSFLRPHKPFLSDLIAAQDIRSAIDVGCGKGRQYEWVDPADGKTLEQAWGFEVRKYDPCWPPFAAEPEPEAKFDLVLCTHTISIIPRADLDWFTGRLFRWADRAVYVAEKIGPRQKEDIADASNRAIEWSVTEWLAFFEDFASSFAPIDFWFSTMERLPEGKITTRHHWVENAWVSHRVEEGEC